MAISARNQLEGKISALKGGVVNSEVELTLAGGDKLVAIVTEASVKSLGLSVGKDVVALIKAPWVILVAGPQTLKFSARNQLSGRVASIQRGAVNTQVGVALPGGTNVVAVVTNEAATELGLNEGADVTALIKAGHIVLAVPA